MARIDLTTTAVVWDGRPGVRLVGKTKLMTLGCFRRVNFGRNDMRVVRKNPDLHRFLRKAHRDMQDGKGVHMTVEELRQRFGIAP